MTILDYHQNPKAEARWANMERVKLVDRGDAVNADGVPVHLAEAWADTAPSELSGVCYDHQGGDVA